MAASRRGVECIVPRARASDKGWLPVALNFELGSANPDARFPALAQA